jgi:murein L,D-transpeptidase YafK
LTNLFKANRSPFGILLISPYIFENMHEEISKKNKYKTRKRGLLIILAITCSASLYFLLTRLGLLMPLSELPSILCLPFCKPEPSAHPVIGNKQLPNPKESLQKIIESKETGKISILIEKSKHRLTVFDNLQPIKSYPVVFGSNPVGNKFNEGDRKTPEGIFHILDLYHHPSWSKFMWLDYPTSQSWREHFQAKLSGKIGWVLPIGGQVGIHGVPTGQDSLIEQRSNWTWGCISLKNEDVNEIYQIVKVGSLVEIIP